MTDLDALVRTICRKEGLKGEKVRPLTGGQVNQIFCIDDAYVLRIGRREDAFERMAQETTLLQRLEGRIPVPRVYAFGELEGRVYQVQEYRRGQMLYRAWGGLRPAQQESIVAELAAALDIIHSLGAPWFGYPRQDATRHATWTGYLSEKFKQTLDEIQALKIHMQPGIVEMASEYFEAHKHVLSGGTPTVIHSDLTLVNILVEDGKLSALLDFEYAMQAPADYELWPMEAFCLYPNEWAEEGHEIYCTTDFASLIPLLRKHCPALFEVPDLRERMNLYQLDAALGSFLGWRKANLAAIPPERMNGRDSYMARITNFIFGHGVRMF